MDQVSGVWTYTLQNSSPIGSCSTQSTGTAQPGYIATMAPALPHNGQLGQTRQAPSVISSVYSHHTYQSIPEHRQQMAQLQNQHIYHTLEPSLLAGGGQMGGGMIKPPRDELYKHRSSGKTDSQ